MAYGGQGAPLAPFFDWLVCRSETKNRILINTGGIANLTGLPAGCGIDELSAFDTGPANVLIDNLMKIQSAGLFSYDRNGETARRGTINEAFLGTMLAEDPFIKLPPPKTTGRELYTMEYAKRLWDRGNYMNIDFPDVLATVTDYTAYTIADAVKRFLRFIPHEIYLSGGGWHNLFMRGRLESRLGLPMRPVTELGINGDAKEACFFAVLANEFLHGRFNNAKKATGAARDVIMGKLCLPSDM
jgi:anhydro-N-acetylmuramic acid kinase